MIMHLPEKDDAKFAMNVIIGYCKSHIDPKSGKLQCSSCCFGMESPASIINGPSEYICEIQEIGPAYMDDMETNSKSPTISLITELLLRVRGVCYNEPFRLKNINPKCVFKIKRDGVYKLSKDNKWEPDYELVRNTLMDVDTYPTITIPWKPTIGENFWAITDKGEVKKLNLQTKSILAGFIATGNYFKFKCDAEKAKADILRKREEILRIYGGD